MWEKITVVFSHGPATDASSDEQAVLEVSVVEGSSSYCFWKHTLYFPSFPGKKFTKLFFFMLSNVSLKQETLEMLGHAYPTRKALEHSNPPVWSFDPNSAHENLAVN